MNSAVPRSFCSILMEVDVHTALSWTVFPTLLFGAIAATSWGIAADFNPSTVVLGVIVLASLPLLVLERLFPFRNEWNSSGKGFSVDVLHMLSTGLTTDLFRALSFAGLLQVSMLLTAWLGVDLWPHHWHPMVQLALALLVGDFGAYWVHRGAHEGALLWRVHAMHHSSEGLHTLSSGRNHPMNAILAYGSQVVPLAILGINVETLALVSVFTAVHGMLQHCNLDLRHGPLNYVFSTVELHRWHHSTDFDESNTNFGSNLIVWDIVFGTRYLPAHRSLEEVGLDDLQMPDNFLVHLASPFTLEQWELAPTEEVERTSKAA